MNQINKPFYTLSFLNPKITRIYARQHDLRRVEPGSQGDFNLATGIRVHTAAE